MNSARAVRVMLRVLLIGVMTLMLFAQGSVRAEPLHVLSLAAYVVAGLCFVLLLRKTNAPGPLGVSMVLAFVLAGWGLFQAGFLGGLVSPNSIWSSAAEILGPLNATVSIAPADTMASLVPICLPFVLFAACYLVFDSDSSATMLLAVGLVIGVVGAVIAILQFEIAPDQLLLASKRYYLDSLTAFFVNRNTGATYLAMQMIVAAGFVFNYASDFKTKDVYAAVLGTGMGNKLKSPRWILLCLLALVIFFTALMLTKSRAGIASGLIGLGLFAVIAVYYGPYRRRTRSMSRSNAPRVSTVVKMSRALLALVLLLAISSLFVSRAVFRAEVRGLEDQRFCLYPSMIRLAVDNWKFGTGFGTFQTAFAPYRPSDCEILSIVDRAHSLYLEAAIACGVIGLMLIAFTLLYLLFIFFRGVRSRKAMRWAPIAGLGVLATVALHSALDFSLQIPGFAVWFAAYMAAFARISLMRQT